MANCRLVMTAVGRVGQAGRDGYRGMGKKGQKGETHRVGLAGGICTHFGISLTEPSYVFRATVF